MFKSVLVASLLLSLLFCAAMDVLARRKIDAEQQMVAQKRAELRPLAPIDQEVLAFRKQKDELQRRIDLINQLKQNQRSAYGAVAAIAALGPKAATIDSMAILDSETIVVNGGSDAVEELKRVAPDRSIVFRGVAP